MLKKWFNTKWYMYHDIIECLVGALEAKDLYTSGHSNRVAHRAYDIAVIYGLKNVRIEKVHIAGHLHDVGKIGIPDNILNKSGKLLPDEYSMIKKHSEIGYDILNKSKRLKNIAKIVLHHHERWDGKGYPCGLKGEEIPLESRIIAISDTIDAMTSNRSYRKAFSWERCREEIFKCKGTQFDPYLVDLTIPLWDKWENKK